MSSLGVHFALTAEDTAALRAQRGNRKRLEFLQEQIEERYFGGQEDWLAESDKAWDAMHRVLADGELTWKGGDYPLNHAVLAGEILYTNNDYIMSLKTPEQVRDIARALTPITKAWFHKRYFAIDPARYGFPPSDEDFEYTWNWFTVVRDLYKRAAGANRYVLFTADQ